MTQDVLFYTAVFLLLTTCFLLGSFALWLARQLQLVIELLEQAQLQTQTAPPATASIDAPSEIAFKHLAKQVQDLQRKVGGLINGLHRMNTEFQNLSHQAAATQTLTLNRPEGGGDDEDGMTHHIVIEVRQAPSGLMLSNRDRSFDPQEVAEMDIPEEVKEKFRAFHAVHKAVVARKKLPSQESPDLN